MRLSTSEQSAIVSSVHAKDPQAVVYLFGSRVRDDYKGGDIDLLVVSETIRFSEKLDILVAIKTAIGEQKIDLKVVAPAQLAGDAFAQRVLPDAIRLEFGGG
jgi:predicted nucleotidyltransferase